MGGLEAAAGRLGRQDANKNKESSGEPFKRLKSSIPGSLGSPEAAAGRLGGQDANVDKKAPGGTIERLQSSGSADIRSWEAGWLRSWLRGWCILEGERLDG